MVTPLLRLARHQLEGYSTRLRPQRRCAQELYSTVYERRIQHHFLFYLVSGLVSFAYSLVFWSIPPYLLYRFYWDTWTEYWWDRGGKWVEPDAFPEYRTAFVVLCYCVPIWAAYMAGIMLAWGLLCAIARRLVSRRTDFSRTSHYRQGSSLENDPFFAENKEWPLEPTIWIRLATREWHLRWWLLLGVYSSLAGFGLYCYNTFEYEPDWRMRAQIDMAVTNPRPEGYAKGDKIYIAALFHDNESVLPFWIEQMNRLLLFLGKDNVYVSVMESYSNDDSPNILRAWERDLDSMGVPNRILIDDTAVARPQPMNQDNRRIQFLAESRNRLLEPLAQMGGFDKVVFINDVFVHAEAVVELLNTRNGDYDVACGMDFAQWGLYDAWVTRDRYGDFVATIHPFLIERSGFEMIELDRPAPVFTCWNGILATHAEPFIPPELRPRNNSVLSARPLAKKLAWTHPAASEHPNTPPRDSPALKFRAAGENECFSSESFLLPYDLRRRFGLERHYINPIVITAYHWDHYQVFKYIYRHWLIQYWVKQIEEGHNVHKAVKTVGDRRRVYTWDGGLCHPMFQRMGIESRQLVHPRDAVHEWDRWQKRRLVREGNDS